MDVGVDATRHFIVMEYVDGGSLEVIHHVGMRPVVAGTLYVA